MENLFASSDLFSSKSNGISAVKNGSDMNSSIEISDLIFNFCNWESQVKNGSVLNQEERIDFESGDGRRWEEVDSRDRRGGKKSERTGKREVFFFL
jgi:hypothetical protein